MIKIETLDGELLSVLCKEVDPIRYESIQKKNKLLDGTYHLQTIGEPIQYVAFTVVAKQIQVEKINLMETKGESIKLTEHKRNFVGYIDKPVAWKRLTVGYTAREKRLYEGRVNLLIKIEVDDH